jgi:hypothetical protein
LAKQNFKIKLNLLTTFKELMPTYMMMLLDDGTALLFTGKFQEILFITEKNQEETTAQAAAENIFFFTLKH